MRLSDQLLEQFLTVAGQDPAADVEFVGADPVLPTPLRLGELGAAAIAAPAVAAARIWRARTGQEQRITVAVDAAAAALRSARYLRPDPPPPAQRRLGGLGSYRTRDDRWVYFQRLFPHHRDRIAAVLGVPLDEESIISAVAGWDAAELEEAVVDAGACAAMVRTAAEWGEHEQGKAVEEVPLLEVLRIGDAAPEPFPAGAGPLAGLRVLDVTRVLAGPTCGRTLAEYGADVLRVGTTGLPDNDAMMRDTGHGKRSCALDLTSAEGNRILRGLVCGADVFVQGYRPGAMDRLGFSPADLAGQRPGIVAVSISAFGHAGPWAGRRGFDSVIQSANGIAARSAGPDGRPRFAPANPLDYVTGYLAALGAMTALLRRAVEGGSWLVRISLAQSGALLSRLPEVPGGTERPAELSEDRLDELMVSRDTPFGRLRYLAPVAQLSATPGRWVLPTPPLEHDAPEWLPR